MKPNVSIGIPTFNRAHLLRESLRSALNQSLREIEILVSDNASTDDTERAVASIGDARVRYVKQSSNLGAMRNFQALADMATADYFCLLQDDDMIFPDLASRAYAALQENPAAAWYASYALSRSDIGLAYNTVLYGPPFALNWTDGQYRKVDGDLLLPLCLFLTPAIPPVTVFKTAAIRRAFALARASDCPLLCERIWVAHASSGNPVILDPYIGGWFRCHPEQACAIMQRDRRAFQRDSRTMREAISALAGAATESLGRAFEQYLQEVPSHTIAQWAGTLSQAQQRSPFDERILAILLRSARGAQVESSLKAVIRSLTPPLLWEFVREHVVPRLPRTPA